MLNIIGPFWHWPITLLILYYNPFLFSRSAILGYLLYIFVLDRNAHLKPSGSTPIRRLKMWKHLAEYFPARLIKTCDLDPKEHYLICGHPHGIACFSYVANFFIEATGFGEVFPGIKLYPALLEQHFFTPFHREIALWSGFRGNSRKALMNVLQGPPGSSVFLLPGGASEALKSFPGTMDLILNKRKGFIRIALRSGAHLVPVIAFGETDLFDITQTKPGTLMHWVQRMVLSLTKFALPIISGSGFFSGAGPLPKALPLTTIIGPPVRVVKWTGPASGPEFTAQVEELHARYCSALHALWEQYNGQYGKNMTKEMEVVE